ncbi:Uncharacterized protein APZ42_017765 [Daphnia magna]|uniref:MULE transposase domain-containing protein n=1 Tax=Daphnia magna TaxID=35525 RepID=A0A164ZL98_9CRUS|nr:Uncharacterized protein APZ42_017765 [Daphnia magna]
MNFRVPPPRPHHLHLAACTPRVIFEQARQEHPNAVIGFDPNLERAIQRARRCLQSAIPHSFDEAERTITGSDMYRVSTDTGNAFIFILLALLPEIRTTREIRSDGTFKTVPNLFYELFTLHVLAYGKSFPVSYVLMSNKTAELYRMAIDRILQILQEVNPGDQFEVEVLISDFELTIMGTMQQAFPNARSRGCWFHYAQAIYRRAYKEGLQRARWGHKEYREEANFPRIATVESSLRRIPGKT